MTAPETIYQKIARMGHELLGADFCTVWPYNQASQEFDAADAGVYGLDRAILTPPRFGGVTFQILTSGYVCEERHEAAGSVHPEIRAFHAAPLEAAPEIPALGVLYASFSQPRLFGEEDRTLLLEFARIAARAIRDVRAMSRARREEQRPRWLRLVNRDALLQKNLNAIAQQAEEESGCDCVTIFSFDVSSRRLLHPPGLSSGVRDPAKTAALGVVKPESFLYQLLRRDAPLFVEQARKTPRFAKSRFPREEQIDAFAAYTLRLSPGNELMGVLFLNYRSPFSFDPPERERLDQLADSAASALNTANLVHHTQQQTRRLSLLKDVSGELGRSESPESAFAAVLKTVRDGLDVPLTNIISLNATKQLFLEAESGWGSPFHPGYIFGPEEAHHARRTIEAAIPFPIDDFALPQLFPVSKSFRERGVLSGLGVPMIRSDNSILGALMVHTTERRHFDEDEEHFLSTLANHTASAVDRLRERDQRSFETALRQQQVEGRDRRILTAAHQMSSPLHYLQDLLDSCLEGAFGELKYRQSKALKEARGVLSDGLSIVDNLLLAAFLESSGERIDLHNPADVGLLLKAVCARFEAWALHREVRLKLEIDCHTALAAIEAFHLRLVVVNLLRNSIQSSPKGGFIRLAAMRANSFIRIDISNSGPALAEPVRESLGQTGFRMNAAMNETGIRLGLGLQISEAILHLFRCRLEAGSPAHGACFSVICPEYRERD